MTDSVEVIIEDTVSLVESDVPIVLDLTSDDVALSVGIEEISVGVTADLISLEVSMVGTGAPGPQGPPGPGGHTEIYDSPTAPVSPDYPYLRFSRDINGDVQYIYLGTSS